MASVTFEQATRQFPGTDRPALDHLDLVVGDGEFVVLVGPSGCGKTTSLRMVAGLETVDSGRIRIGDRDVTRVEPKDRDVAMVELLNIVRPVVAVARFAAFAALALWTHPEARAVAAESDAGARSVAQEVRRTAPFFPLIGGVATRELAWRGVGFSPGDRVIVDLFATNRDPRHWPAAGSFDAQRFVDGRGEEDIVAQGAGSWSDGHRCPGEPATVDLLSAFVSELAGRRWEAPHQDLGVSLSRLPARAGRPGIRIRMLDGNR